MTRLTRLAGALLALLVTACSASESDRFRFWSHAPLSETYLEVLPRWTRENQVAEELSLRLGLSATLMAPEFRAALETEVRRLLDLPPGAPSPILPPPVAGGVDIVVAVAGPSDRELELEARTPFWHLVLIDAQQGRYRPAKIARIDDRSPERRFFPFHDNWSRLYLVSFPPEVPHQGGAGTLTLEITGVYGRTQASWVL